MYPILSGNKIILYVIQNNFIALYGTKNNENNKTLILKSVHFLITLIRG